MEKIENISFSKVHQYFQQTDYLSLIDAIWKDHYGSLIGFFGNVTGAKSLLVTTDKYLIFLDGVDLYEFDFNNINVELIQNNLLKGIMFGKYQIKVKPNIPVESAGKADSIQFGIGKVIFMNGARTVRYDEYATKALANYIQTTINLFKKLKEDFIDFNILTFDDKKGIKKYSAVWCIEKLLIFESKICIINDGLIEINKKDIKSITYEEKKYLAKKFKLITITDSSGNSTNFGSYNAGLIDNKNTFVMFRALEKWRSIF